MKELDSIHIHRFKWLEPNEFKALIYFKGLKDNFRLLIYLISLFFNLMWISRKYDIESYPCTSYYTCRLSRSYHRKNNENSCFYNSASYGYNYSWNR